MKVKQFMLTSVLYANLVDAYEAVMNLDDKGEFPFILDRLMAIVEKRLGIQREETN